MKKLNALLNVVMGTFAGVFIGNGIYVVWNYKMRPELYATQSSPWYTSILVSGIVTFAMLLICTAIKYSLQGTTQGNGLTGGLPPVRFSM